VCNSDGYWLIDGMGITGADYGLVTTGYGLRYTHLRSGTYGIEALAFAEAQCSLRSRSRKRKCLDEYKELV
jgi:hypothetical protein